ncbi:MAG TPA: alpha-amylase family glycosyl hydrolase, partial [Pyrinomonadaceae bacterium]|nr:alpha-amylase family glycosyl hydrolase [Pyrinomonadaceae bacterium]
ALRDVLKYDGLYPNRYRLTTLTANHDIDRFMSTPGATLEGAMMHMAFMLSVRGIPQIYYGDELAMTGGHDPENRKDFPGGFRGDQRNAFTREGRTAEEQRMFEWTRRWMNARRESIAMANGTTTDLFYDKDAYVFERRVQLVDWMAAELIAFNASDKEKVIEVDYVVPERIALFNLLFRPVISDREKIKSDGKRLRITMAPRSAFVYEIKPAL